MFDARAAAADQASPLLDESTQAIVNDLLGSLLNHPPQASQAAEAALTLAAFSLVEGRVLNLLEGHRLEGDRAAGDRLCAEVLTPRNIPATKGPLQSSSYRSGYIAPQARRNSLSRYVEWQSDPDRRLEDVERIAEALIDGFLACSASLPPLPALIASRFTFIAYRQARDALLADSSGGALEQYLLAGLLHQELSANSSTFRAVTKSVGASDTAAGAAGDIEIRQGMALRGVIEVTAASWEDKLSQLENVVRANLSETSIAATNVAGKVSGAELAEKVAPEAERLGLDVSVIDLYSLMDVAASRITRAGRKSAFESVYRCLAAYHRRQPELAERLIRVLSELDLVSSDETTPHTEELEVGIGQLIGRVKEFLDALRIANHPDAPSALRELASLIETENNRLGGR